MDTFLQAPEDDVSRHEVDIKPSDRWVAGGIALVCLLVYLRSLLPGVGHSGDTAKWQFLGHVGGVPHATGYPLYLIVNKVFVAVVPWGSLAWRANLLSAVLAVLVVALLYLLLRLLSVSWAVAAATALVFAFTKTFWTQAVVAEVYTLHLALMCAVVICLARWRLAGPVGREEAADREERDTHPGNWWLVGGLSLYAVSYGNHMGTVLLLPGIVWLLWPARQRVLVWRNVLVVSGAGMVTVLLYGYVLHMARAGRYVESQVDGLGDLVGYVTGGSFRDQMVTFSLAELATTRLGLTVRILVEELFVLLPLAGYGVWRAFRQSDPARRAVMVLVGQWGLAAWLFAINFDVVDVVVFFLPSFLVLTVFMGVGLEGTVTALRTLWPANRRVAAAASVALVALPLAALLVDYRRASQRGTVDDAERIKAAIETADRDAVLLTDGYHDSEYIWYFLLGEDIEATRNLALAHMVTPKQVKGYMDGAGGRVTKAVDQVKASASNLDPDGPPLYTPSETQARELRAAGLEVTEVDTGVWQVMGG